MDKRNIIIPWISICCLLFGMYTGFATEFNYGKLDWQFLVGWTVVLSAGAVMLTLQRKPWVSGLLTVPALILAGLYGYSHMEQLKEAADAVQLLLGRQMAKYNGTAVLSDAASIVSTRGIRESLQEGQMEILFLLCGFFVAVYICIVTMRLSFRIYGLILPYTVVLVGMSVGASPGVRSVFLLFAGTALALYQVERNEADGSGQREKGTAAHFKIPWGLAVLCLCIVLCTVTSILLNSGTREKILSHAKATLSWQHKKERQFKEFGNTIVKAMKARFGVDNDGKLDNDAPEYGDKDVLRFTMDYKPEGDVYLRGFVGSDYSNGRWTFDQGNENAKFNLENIIHSLVMGPEWRDRLLGDERDYLMEKADIQKLYLMEADAVGLKRTNKDEMSQQAYPEVNWELEYVGAGKRSTYYYHPYFDWMEDTAGGDESQKMDAAAVHSALLYDDMGEWQLDRRIKKFSDKAQGKFYYMGIQQMQERVDHYGEWSEEFSDWSTLPSENILLRDDVLNEYVDYARKRFIRVPKDLREFAEFADNLGIYGGTAADIAVQIRAGLWKQASYSKNLEAVPIGKDYVEYFLLEQKKGFCEHFATAGTLLFRHYGVPAKFVSGYRVPAEAFVDNGDGTYTANVQDSYSHAWSEVLVGGLGWYPMEMTPGAAGVVRGQYDEEENAAQPEPTPTEEALETATPEPTATESPQTAQNSDSLSKKDGVGKRKITQAQWGIMAAMVILLLCLSLWIWCRYSRGKYSRSLKKLKGQNSRAIRILTEELICFLTDCGIRGCEKMTEREWIEQAFTMAEGEEAGNLSDTLTAEQPNMDKLRYSIEKAFFANEAVTSEEYEGFLEICDILIGKILQQKRGWHKFIILFFGWRKQFAEWKKLCYDRTEQR